MPTLSAIEKKSLISLLEREAYYAGELQGQLQSALKEIYGEMKVIYNKWAKNGILTKAEMTRYNKYQSMEKQILKLLDPALKDNIQTIRKLMPDMYNESFFHAAWEVDNTTGLRLSYGNVNTKALLAAFDITNPKNIELAEALRNYGPNAKKSMRSALLNGLSQGKSYNKMAADIERSISKIFSSAMTIARTEGQRAQNKGQDDAYLRARENGVDGYQVWSATLDQRTRPDHGAMDGKRKQKDGLYHFPNGELAQYPCDPNLPSEQSINCRCRERFEIEGYSPQLMRTRAEGVLAYQNYSDYVDQYHPEWKKVIKPIPIVNKVVPRALKQAKPIPRQLELFNPPIREGAKSIAITPRAPNQAVSQSVISNTLNATINDPYYTTLSSANIVSIKANDGRGINPSYVVKLKAPTGEEFKGILKKEHTGDPVINEYATYLTDRAIGTNVVPNVVYRDYKLPEGGITKATMMEFFLDSKEAMAYMPSSVHNRSRTDYIRDKVPHEELLRVSILDYITGNADRHERNYMISSKGKVAAIDNGRALWKARPEDYVVSEPWYIIGEDKPHKIPKAIMSRINSLDTVELGKRLKGIGIDKAVVKQTLSRIIKLRNSGTLPKR